MSFSYSVNAKVGEHGKTKSFQFQDKVHRYALEDNVLFRFQKCEGMKTRIESLNVQTSSEFGMYKNMVDLGNQSFSLVIDGDDSEKRPSV